MAITAPQTAFPTFTGNHGRGLHEGTRRGNSGGPFIMRSLLKLYCNQNSATPTLYQPTVPQGSAAPQISSATSVVAKVPKEGEGDTQKQPPMLAPWPGVAASTSVAKHFTRLTLKSRPPETHSAGGSTVKSPSFCTYCCHLSRSVLIKMQNIHILCSWSYCQST